MQGLSRRRELGGIHIINASLASGGPANKNCDKQLPFNGIINKLFKAGIVIVVSSGNDAFHNGIAATACHSKTIAVGAVYDADIGPQNFPGLCADETTQAGQITCYSNSGVPLDVLAPSQIATTTASGGGYRSFGGTSAAAPYVAGVIAQLRSRIPKATPAKIRAALMSTGTPIRDINGIVRNLISGPGAYKKLGGRWWFSLPGDSGRACPSKPHPEASEGSPVRSPRAN